MKAGPGEEGSRLYLLRHAKAEQATGQITREADHARRLAARGRDDAAAMGAWMRARGLSPDVALVSNSARTAETFDLLQPLEPRPRLVPLEELYLAGPDRLLALLQAQDQARSVLLVAHNPGLHELALLLSAANPVLQGGLPTCTLVGFRLSRGWTELSAEHATLTTIHRP